MNTSINDDPELYSLQINDIELVVHLKDGRRVHVPIRRYPSLSNASNEELMNFEIIAGGEGIHWPDLDEDLSVKGFLQGVSLSESKRVFKDV